MQLKQLVQRLQSVLAEHGNIDVVVPHPNVEQTSTVGTPLFHLDVVNPNLDHFVMVGVGSVNGLRPYVAQSPVNPTFLRLTPYSMQRVQALHDMRNGSMPVTEEEDVVPQPLANEPEIVQVSSSTAPPASNEDDATKPAQIKSKKKNKNKTKRR